MLSGVYGTFENWKRLTPDSAMLISELADSLKSIDKPIVFAGDGAAVTYEKLSGHFDNIILADAQNRYQRASSVAFLTENISIQVNYRLAPTNFYRFI